LPSGEKATVLMEVGKLASGELNGREVIIYNLFVYL
jgi:hypothetical protein